MKARIAGVSVEHAPVGDEGWHAGFGVDGEVGRRALFGRLEVDANELIGRACILERDVGGECATVRGVVEGEHRFSYDVAEM